MKVYAIFLICVVGVWAFARVSDELDQRIDGRTMAAILHDNRSDPAEDAEMVRAQAVLAEQEDLENAAEEEGIDVPAPTDCPSHCPPLDAP